MLKVKNAIIDGEILVLDSKGMPLQRFQSDRKGELMYLVFLPEWRRSNEALKEHKDKIA
jgi:hypothetical protein